jgi:hypothetical protein
MFFATFAGATGITYDCDPSISQNTCNYLNNTVAAIYNNTFINANAVIYVSLSGDIGSNDSQSEYWFNFVPYTDYLLKLGGTSSGDAVDVAALDSLNQYATPVYLSGDVAVTGALGQALGFSTAPLDGVTSDDSSNCTLGTSGCYAGDIELSTADFNSAGSLGAYNLATAVEHETDEILGTGSCIGQDGSTQCNGGRVDYPSAVDLFRYSAPGSLVAENSIVSTPNAYFSYNGGASNGADGALYNDSTGLDYADFQGSCAYVQDGTGCGNDVELDITNDGPGGTAGPEVTILDAIGYNLTSSASSVPEPGTMGLFGAALAVLALRKRRRARHGRA